MTAVEAKTDSILADFSPEDPKKRVLITTKVVVHAIVKAVQKQLDLCLDKRKINNILECKHKEGKLEQYSWKRNVRINGIKEE